MIRDITVWLAALLWPFGTVLCWSEEAIAEPRTFEFTYAATVSPPSETRSAADVFLPVATSDAHQSVTILEIESDVEGTIDREVVYGNRFWHARIPASRSEPLNVSIRYRVERTPFDGAALTRARSSLSAEERIELARFLGPNRRVPVGDEVLDPILSEIRSSVPSGDPAALARAIYDWVVGNVEYKKVGTGWGNGDTWWACSARYGNCTDFHSLYISLARTEGIPARFEMGFPVPTDRPESTIGGYHCWIEFYIAGVGWLPIDASEASKHRERRGEFYARAPADRVRFSTGRDLRLGEFHRGEPLNYFVHPYVEVDGRAADGDVETRYSYRELDVPTPRARYHH